MGVFNAAGTRLNQAGVTTSAASDVEKVLAFDLYETVRYSDGDAVPQGSIRKRLASAGEVVRQSWLDSLFPDPTITGALSPATGGTAGGTVVTINGTNLDGATGVTFGGTAGTSLVIVSPTQIKVTTPAKTAGALNVVVTTDGGTATATNGFTYA